MAFAKQKVQEVGVLTCALNEGRAAVADELAASRAAVESRARSPRIHNGEVQQRLAGVNEGMLRRAHPFAERRPAQRRGLPLPPLPTTTIGSYPQTSEVRKARAALRKGEWSLDQYEAFCRRQIEKTVRFQEEIDLDVLVHGEFERADMVEYFGEQLEGFAFTAHGWVQSYGTRCVKPPVIFGDVSRRQPMTVRWSQYAKSLTSRPMKGMLTGPVTILQWSFVRDDQPRRDTAFQIGLAIRDEVIDLEAAGIHIIQIDEPALREGLPLRRAAWAGYLRWAVDAFRLASAGVRDETQIHTHMCYSEFNDIIESIAALDADVISIEASRSEMELLNAFVKFKYPNEIGPGVYDIHSPRVPETEEIMGRLQKALRAIPPDMLWVNPDCGLKTRGWPEVHAALRNMVEAAKKLAPHHGVIRRVVRRATGVSPVSAHNTGKMPVPPSGTAGRASSGTARNWSRRTIMNVLVLHLALVTLAAAAGPTAENPLFQDLVTQGVKMSDGTRVKLPPPILADGLTAAGQRAALIKVSDARNSVKDLVAKSYYAPVVVKVRTVKASEDEGPAIRGVDLWFTVHGDWNTLTSREFLESVLKPADEGPSRVVAKSGFLNDQELAARKLSTTVKEGFEERFVYSTFSLFERVEISATRFAVLKRDKSVVLAAGRVDPRFTKDADYPNQWRPLVRNERAEIERGPAHPWTSGGGYAKITRLIEPADAVLVECHIVYEEPYGWFDGANLVKQKGPLIVLEKVRVFRRKLATASTEKKE